MAGAAFVAPQGGEGGGGGLGGVGADEVLPFTGSLLTLPIALLGLVLTFLGWALTHFGVEKDGS